jgi:hypothetical protein
MTRFELLFGALVFTRALCRPEFRVGAIATVAPAEPR